MKNNPFDDSTKLIWRMKFCLIAYWSLFRRARILLNMSLHKSKVSLWRRTRVLMINLKKKYSFFDERQKFFQEDSENWGSSSPTIGSSGKNNIVLISRLKLGYLRRRVVFLLRRIHYWLVLFKRITLLLVILLTRIRQISFLSK